MKRSIIIVGFLLLVLITAGAVINLNRGAIGSADLKPVFSFDAEYDFTESGGKLLAVNNDGVTAVSDSGEVSWEAIKQMASARVVSAGDYVLLFDKGASEACVYKNGSELCNITTDQPILNAKINEKGYSVIISYEIGYKSKIEVYDRHGALIYSWKLGEGYAIDADVSPDAKTVSAIILYTDDGALESCVAIADINREIAVAEHRKKDILIFSVDYQANGNIVVVGESKMFGYNDRGEEKWSVEYGDKALKHYKVPYSSSIALVFAGGRNNSRVEFYNERGVKKGEYTSDTEITSIAVKGSAYAVAEARQVTLLNNKGKVKTKFPISKDIKDVVLISEREVAVVTNGVVEIVR